MLQALAPDLWHVPYAFVTMGIPMASRMTVIRLRDARLWLHSPVPISSGLRDELLALGPVAYVVAPSKAHHLFAGDCASTFLGAQLFGAPGLAAKRADLRGLRTLQATGEPEWQDELEQRLFEGIPLANEVVWFHKPTRTLILTDLCQWWQGPLPVPAALLAHLTGVRKQLAVPRTMRLLTKDRRAAQRSARAILEWPFERVMMTHNAIIERDAHAAVAAAFSVFRV
ncbi:MAG TPA: DUF4336 domain-containing protein [Noviherbaspirillum sp.]